VIKFFSNAAVVGAGFLLQNFFIVIDALRTEENVLVFCRNFVLHLRLVSQMKSLEQTAEENIFVCKIIIMAILMI
jgi:hypothetical protein